MFYLRQTTSALLISGIILSFFPVNIVYGSDEQDLQNVKSRVLQLQQTDANLPGGVTEQKGKVGTLLSTLFDVNGKIKRVFLEGIFTDLTGGELVFFNDTTNRFVSSPIFTNGSLLGIGGGVLTGYIANFSGDVRVTGDLNVQNQVQVSEICDENGANCVDVSSGFGGFWSRNGSNEVYYDSANVGIGINNPDSQLEVLGELKVSGNGDATLVLEADKDNVTETDNANIALIQDGGLVQGRIGYRSGTNQLEFMNQTNDNMYFGTANTTRMTILGNGNVGIGNAGPGDTLDVNGTLDVTGTIQVDDRTVISGAGDSMFTRFTDDTHYGFYNVMNNSNERGAYFGYGNGGSTVSLFLDEASQLNITGGNTNLGNNRLEGLGNANSGDDAVSRNFADGRYVNVGESINGDDITDGTIDSSEIQDNTLTANDLASNSVGSSEVAANSLTSADLAANSVTSSELASNSVTSAKITDGTITASDLAANSVAASEIASNAVGTAEVANNTLTANDLATGSVGTLEVVDNSLTANDLAGNSVGTSEVADNSLTANDLAANSVGTSEVVNNSLTASDLAANSVGASELAANSVYSSEIANNTITETDISDSFVARNSQLLDGIDSSAFVRETLGTQNGEINREVKDNGIYSYNVVNSSTNKAPNTNYGSVLTWGRGAGGSAQISAGWTSGDQNSLYFRSLRDTINNWWSWKQIWHSGNFNPTSIPGDNIQDGTIDGSEIQDNTLTANDLAANSVGASELIESQSYTVGGLTVNGASTLGSTVNPGTRLYFSSNSNRNYFAPRLGDNSNWAWGDEFGYNNDSDNWYFETPVIGETPTASNHLTTKSYVDTLVTAGVTWKAPVPTGSSPTGTYGTCNASKEGWTTYNQSDDIIYLCNASAWVSIGSTASIPYATTTSAGKLQISGDLTGTWNNVQLKSNSVGSAEVASNSLTAADLAANSVGTSEVADNSLTASDLAANSVGNSELTDNVTVNTLSVTGGGSATGLNVQGTSSMIKFTDTDASQDNFWAHVNSNNFYVLADRDNNGAWDGSHPLQLEADTNTAYSFGGKVWTSTNDGAGSTLDADSVDGIAGASLLRSNANDSLTATTKVTGSIIHEDNGNMGYIAHPKGGYYRGAASVVTGAIRICLPTHGTADMLGFKVDVFDYTNNESVTVDIFGYLYQTTGANEWVNTTASVRSSLSAKDYNVRFGGNGTNNCVWIGETNSTWSYPQVMVRDFFGGYSTDIDAYDDGWTVTFQTAFDTIDETRSNNFPYADWNKIKNRPGSFDTTPDTIADDGIIQETEIAQNTLDDSEIQDNSLTAGSLAANSVNASEITDGQVRTQEIANNTITETDISDSFVARNSQLLDGIDGANFLRSNVDDTFLGKLSVGSTNNRRAGIYGVYDSTKIGHIWSMGTAYQIPQNGSNFGNLYGLAYKHTNNTTGGTMASGHQAVWTQNGTPNVAIGTNVWTSGEYRSDGVTVINGSAYVVGDRIQQNSVDSSEIQDNTLTAADLAANSVGTSEVADNSLTANDLATNSVGNAELIDQPTITQLNVTAGDNNGIKFWGSDSYEIAMGNSAEYHYGPVTTYSIKNKMSNTAGRGWTWGVAGLTPVASIEATTGNAQFKGTVTAATPTAASHLATKAYVDASGGGFWESDGGNEIKYAGDNADVLVYSHNGADVNAGPDFELARSGGTEASPSIVSNDDSLGRFVFRGYDGNSYNRVGFISTVVDGTPADNNIPVEMIFGLDPSSTWNSSSVKMVIKSDGDVGIGDTSPDGSLKLDVEGRVGASHYCDQNGNNCIAASAIGGGSGLDPDRTLTQKADIGSGINLNNMATTGLYHQNANAYAAAGSNYPVDLAGMLQVVEDGNMVYQTYHVYGNNNEIYSRGRYNGTWSSWNNMSDGLSEGYWQVDGSANGGGSAGDDLKFEGNNADVRLYSWSDCDSCKADLEFYKSKGNSDAAKSSVGSSDTLGGIRFSGYDGDEYLNTAGIFAEVVGTPSNNNIPTRLEFYVASDDMIDHPVAADMVIQENGYVGMGDTSPGYRLELPNSAWTAGRGRANAWHTYSSRRWKENIQPIEGALENVQKLQGITYNWKEEQGGTADIGFVAEEVGAIYPEMVEWEDNGVDAKGLAYDRLTAVLVEAVKEVYVLIQDIFDTNEEQDKEIDSLNEQIEISNARVAELEKQLEEIHNMLK